MLGFDRGRIFAFDRTVYRFEGLSTGLYDIKEDVVLKARIVCRFAGPACKLCQLSLGSKNRGSICAELNPACAIVR